MDRIPLEPQYDHTRHESEAQTLWRNEKTYHFVPDAAKKTFSIDTPPPTVSGSLHIGHVYSYTHADLIARYKRMKGFNVFYPMGFDDNGLPTERFVEKKNATKAHLIKRSDFIDLCLKETETVEKLFEHLWQQLGLSIDWTTVYSTISAPVRRVAQYGFLDLYKKGLIYRKEEPALYCTTCRTSVAQAELDGAEVATTFNNIVFKTQTGEELIIATTRPELLPACVAVFYHPEDSRYKHLQGAFAVTPIFEKLVKIIPDEKVDPAKGTGLVMCCTFGDVTDIHWFKTHKLPFAQVIGLDGKWTNAAGPLAGLTVHEARKKILELLATNEALREQKSITHNVNTHERCKQEIEYQILSQWFVKILDHKEEFLALADKINWYPSFMKTRYRDWVSNLNWDWCISRQRFFGIPFPAWHCQGCGHTVIADAGTLPIDPQEQLPPGGHCPKCNSSNLQADTDVMDTWNTSGHTPHILTKWPDAPREGVEMPMSMRPQAHDIIRTWAFYTIIKAYYHNNTIPWHDIVISGHVLAGKGEKISKSKENSKMTPEGLLNSYPADVIRYWSACGRLGTDTAFSENQLKIGQRLVTKMWNAFRFINEHVDLQNVDNKLVQNPLNQWMLDNLSSTYSRYQAAFDSYEYQNALEVAERFFWQDFCDNYLELVKDQFFNPEKYTAHVLAETKFALSEAGFALLQLFAPFMPHLTESLYQSLYKNSYKASSLHLTLLDNKRFGYSFANSKTLINLVLDIVARSRKLKSEKQISLKTELAQLTINVEEAVIEQLKTQQALIAGITKAKVISYQAGICQAPSLEQTEHGLVACI
jgi:valyl-tRNA synthetase